MPKYDYDFLIIGQGLAGSMLAFCLIEAGFRVLVIDNQHKGSASKVAAGIINPITGHRLNLTEGFEHYFASATKLYDQLEQALKVVLLQPLKQQRLIKNQGQYEYYLKRKDQKNYCSFLGDLKPTKLHFNSNSYGSISIKQTAIVNTSSLLDHLKSWLSERSSYMEAKLDYKTLLRSGESFSIVDKTAKQVIFCEGYQAINNPWLEHLPFKLSKGEVLTVQTNPVLNDKMLNWGSWMLPALPGTESRLVKLGSNYDWIDLDLTPNPQTAAKLLDSLKQFTPYEAELVRSDVGIRPTTVQRHPFVGRLINLEHAFCFNGFGSKGCLLIPHYAQLLCQHLVALGTATEHPLPTYLTKWI
jgi:glycine/D-amino acid oxidase-like deaminating enzyme